MGGCGGGDASKLCKNSRISWLDLCVRFHYPPSMTMEKQGQVPPVAPLGYPTNAVPENQVPAKIQSRSDDFWKGWPAFNVHRDNGILLHTEKLHQQLRDHREPKCSRQTAADRTMSLLGCHLMSSFLFNLFAYPSPMTMEKQGPLPPAPLRPAFNILRDHEILPLPDDFVSMFI
ncbi:hypothetical protein Tco_0390930 [Tanacetum coccineum]